MLYFTITQVSIDDTDTTTANYVQRHLNTGGGGKAKYTPFTPIEVHYKQFVEKLMLGWCKNGWQSTWTAMQPWQRLPWWRSTKHTMATMTKFTQCMIGNHGNICMIGNYSNVYLKQVLATMATFVYHMIDNHGTAFLNTERNLAVLKHVITFDLSFQYYTWISVLDQCSFDCESGGSEPSMRRTKKNAWLQHTFSEIIDNLMSDGKGAELYHATSAHHGGIIQQFLRCYVYKTHKIL